MINEQLARSADLQVGDVVSIGEQPLAIAGVYADYGNPIGQAIIAESLFQTLFPKVLALRFGLRLPLEDVGAFVEGLQSEVGLPASSVINQASIKAYSLAIFDRTFTVTTALNILTLSVCWICDFNELINLNCDARPTACTCLGDGFDTSAIGAA